MSSTYFLIYSKFISPILLTAVPSAIVFASLSSTTSPFCNAASADAAPSGSTPITFICGFFNFAAQAIPETKPPPPRGTRIISALGNSSSISSAIVPCPSNTSSSLKGCTKI
jgi:hypothetical protein